MTDPNRSLQEISGEELLRATQDLVRRSSDVEVELLIHLGAHRCGPRRATVAGGGIVDRALDLLIDQVKKERFATGRKSGRTAEGSEGSRPVSEGSASSRHVPDAIRRVVYERDGGRCTFTDDRGRRCPETGALEFDHLDGFACTRRHDADQIRLLCRAHNQYAADLRYGRAFMDRARSSGATRPGASLAHDTS